MECIEYIFICVLSIRIILYIYIANKYNSSKLVKFPIESGISSLKLLLFNALYLLKKFFENIN